MDSAMYFCVMCCSLVMYPVPSAIHSSTDFEQAEKRHQLSSRAYRIRCIHLILVLIVLNRDVASSACAATLQDNPVVAFGILCLSLLCALAKCELELRDISEGSHFSTSGCVGRREAVPRLHVRVG